MLRRPHTQFTGFTLIELLVVMAVVSFLASLTIASVNRSRVLARDATRKSDAALIRKALELYFQDQNVYPMNGAVGNPNNETDASNLADFLAPQYLPKIPIDPKSEPSPYQYVWKQNGKQYGLLVPFGNDGGTNCKFMADGGSQNWFSSAPLCSY